MRLDGKGRVAGTLWPTAAGRRGRRLGPRLQGPDPLLPRGRRRSRRAGLRPGPRRVEGARRPAGPLLRRRPRQDRPRGAHAPTPPSTSARRRGSRSGPAGEADLDAAGRIAAVPWAGLATVEASAGRGALRRPAHRGAGQGGGVPLPGRGPGVGERRGALPAAHPDRRRRPRVPAAAPVTAGRWPSTCWRGPSASPRRRTTSTAASTICARRWWTASPGPASSRRPWTPRRRWRGRPAGRPGPSTSTSTPSSGRAPSSPAASTPAGWSATSAPWRRCASTGPSSGAGPGPRAPAGTWSFAPPFPWDLALEFSDLPLSDLDLAPGLEGSATGTASLGGSPARPHLRLSASGAGVGARPVSLGAARLTAQIDGDQVEYAASAEGVKVTGQAGLGGRLPFRAHATLSLEDATRLVPGLAPAGLRLAAAGELSAEGELADWRDARVEARLTQLQAAYAELRIESTGPAQLDRLPRALGAGSAHAAGAEHRRDGERRLPAQRRPRPGRLGRVRPAAPLRAGPHPAPRGGQLAVEARLVGPARRAAGWWARASSSTGVPAQGRRRCRSPA